MPDLALDLRFLRYAILVAEHGSFRRAADAMNLSQSTVSRRIQLLERRVGVPLFERSRSGVRPTPAGERFIREAAFGAEHIRQAVSSLTALIRDDVVLREINRWRQRAFEQAECLRCVYFIAWDREACGCDGGARTFSGTAALAMSGRA